MGFANALEESGNGARPPGDPSVSSSLEHLIASSQGVITKRVDLALLEGQELLSNLIERAALAGLAILLAAGTWFAVAGAFVLLIIPNPEWALRLTAFGLVNAAATLGLIRIVQRGNPSFAPAPVATVSEAPPRSGSRPAERS